MAHRTTVTRALNPYRPFVSTWGEVFVIAKGSPIIQVKELPDVQEGRTIQRDQLSEPAPNPRP